MRKVRWQWKIILFLMFAGLFCPVKVHAEETGSYLSELSDEMDYGKLDTFLENYGMEKVSFSGLVEELMQDGVSTAWGEHVFSAIKTSLVGEIAANRKMLLEIVLLAFCFSVLKNFAGAFHASYISELCFLLVYCVMAVMLLQTFLLFQEVVSKSLESCVEFMKVMVPTFCLSMMFASNVSSAAGFYQTAFLVIYLVEWLFLNLLMPLIHIYVLLEIFGHFVPEERFSNLTELFSEVINWGIKIAGVLVLGLNVVQNLIGPAKDRMGHGIFAKTASVIPGLGNAVGSVTELLLGAGIVMKSCVGTAGLVVLVLISLVPMLKALCLAFFYKLAAAVTEPVSDKRISGCLKGLANGGMLYVKLLGYSVLLFFVTIALTAAASGFIY